MTIKLRRLKWFFALVWRPWPGGPITVREAWAAAGCLAPHQPTLVALDDLHSALRRYYGHSRAIREWQEKNLQEPPK